MKVLWPMPTMFSTLFVALLATAAATQLSGTYTVDPQGSGSRNYKSFGDATAALKAGVSGPVVFQVAPVTFKVLEVNFYPVSGASSTNTISFVAPHGQATIDGSGYSGPWVMRPNAGWYRFANLRLINWTGSGLSLSGGGAQSIFENIVVEQGSGWAVSGSIDGIFRNCTFRGKVHPRGSILLNRCEVEGDVKITDSTIMQNCFVHGGAGAGYVLLAR